MVSYSSLCIYWEWPKQLRKFQIITVLLAGFFIHFTLGSIYTDGNLIPYVVSYIRERSYPQSLRNTDAIIILAVKELGATVSMPIGGWLEKYAGPRIITLFGCWLMSLGIIMSYFTLNVSFWVFLVVYGLLFGIGEGIAYVPPIACAIRWLPKWKGIASGTVLCGYGLAAFVINTVQTLYINFHNKEPNYAPYSDHPNEKYFTQPELLNKVPQVFLILGGAFMIIQTIGAIFLVNPPLADDADEIREPAQNVNEENEALLNSTDDHGDQYKSINDDDNGFKNEHMNDTFKKSMKQLLKSRNFYLFFFMSMCAGIVTAFMSGLFKTFGFELVTSNDHFLTVVGSVASIFNCIGRIPWGMMVDFTGYKFAFIFHGSITGAFIATLYIASTNGKILYFIWVCAIFCGIGGYFAFFPVAVAKSFGVKLVGLCYGLLGIAMGIGGILGSLVSKYIVRAIDWYGAIIVLTIVHIVELVLALFLRSG